MIYSDKINQIIVDSLELCEFGHMAVHPRVSEIMNALVEKLIQEVKMMKGNINGREISGIRRTNVVVGNRRGMGIIHAMILWK
jgi:acid phosphatase family membrane protein YuiD